MQLYVAASVENDGDPAWDLVEPEKAESARHGWVELSCRAERLRSTFLLRDRASWLVWGAGLARFLPDRQFARRFHLHGPPSNETLAPFTATVRESLLRVPRFARFQVYASRLDECHASLVANWPLRGAPKGIVSVAAAALQMMRSAPLQAAASTV